MKSETAKDYAQPRTFPKADGSKKSPSFPSRKSLALAIIDAIALIAPKLARIGPLRRYLAGIMEKRLRAKIQREIDTKVKPIKASEDRMEIGISVLRTIERSIGRGRLSQETIRKVLNVLASGIFINKGEPTARARFIEQYKTRPPEILLICPTKGCNLRCKGCYADSASDFEKLSWPTLNRLLQEARDMWGARFIALTGGEPLAYHDQGKDILDLVERHPDYFFLMYTNGTLIDDKVAKRMGKLGNIIPAISVEGLQESTDQRRGEGIFDKIVSAMERLRREKVFFGISMTATRKNAEEILSDDVTNFYFDEMDALLAWVFHYMPIGRAITLDLMPTPEQRLWMWRRCWQLIKERNLFIVDFWNGGTMADGCISAGRAGGYLCINWNGHVTSCAFMPYSPVNINEAYAQGKTLMDVWSHPFFIRIRDWQREYGYDKNFAEDRDFKNWIMPCPIRDHYDKFFQMQREFQLKPVDENAREALLDPEYREGMKKYNQEVAALLDPIWRTEYLEQKE